MKVKKARKSKKNKFSSFVILIVSIIFIGLFAFAGFKGFTVAGYQVKPFNEVMIKGLDLQGGVSVLMQIDEPDVSPAILHRVKDLLALRVNKVGVAETVVTTEGDNQIRINIPGKYDSNSIVQSLTSTGKLEFLAPNGSVILTGKDVVKASAYPDGQTGEPTISLEFNDAGKVAFAKATKEYIGKQIKITMDGVTLTDPVVQSQILNGQATITGSTSMADAQKTAGIINAGALPVPIKEVSVQTVGAQLGATALPDAVKAGAVGIAIIFIFMILYYRGPGVAASLALSVYILAVLYTYISVKVTLTLPGIAGFLLTIGMAVDANVLIFERIKEELKIGRSVKAAIKAGFKNAMSSILDSNTTTIIAALVLYFLGSGPVKGFALTLMIGIVISMFTAIFVTKFFMNIFFDMGVLNNPRIFGVKIKGGKPDENSTEK
ncbi:protein translocase subunit SecD [uncultured Clostridium sp.]|uniref:protein translocase subunit SecD n=1 Tax=uncultured Clostridium sp. TaxID=59620 RepID=UPI00260AABB1|nr:protein translocase subunit SecD [uncultured Clostridium sp.]